MKKYTYNEWLEGKDLVKAESENFSPNEWGKIKNKQKELFNIYRDQNFEYLVDHFHTAIENSLDQEVFIKSSFKSLERIFDTSYKYPTQELKKKKSGELDMNIQVIDYIGELDYNELRNCFIKLMMGRIPYHMIKYPNREKPESTDDKLSLHIFTAALYKLYKYIETEYKNIVQPEIQYIEEKIKWLGSPSQFGYLFLQLIDGGFIELPIGRGNPNYAKLARMCLEKFQIKGKSSSITKELTPKGNSLEPPNRIAFKIPDIKDLS